MHVRSLAVLNPILHRLTAWLCLVAALVTGVAPAHGLVLCVEPDGCVSVQFSSATDHCVDCGDHVGTSLGSATANPAPADDGCPCVDVPVPGSTRESSLQPKSIQAPLLQWLALLPAFLALPSATPPLVVRMRRIEVPRPPDSLCLIRSVVLLV